MSADLDIHVFCLSLQIVKEPNIKVLYAADERYTLKRSFYSKQISTSNSAVQPSQYLSITVDAEEKRQLEQQMKVRGTYLDFTPSFEVKLKHIQVSWYSYMRQVRVYHRLTCCVAPCCDQVIESKLRDIDEQLTALQQAAGELNHKDNALLMEKKQLSELKGKRRQLEQKISTKQDR